MLSREELRMAYLRRHPDADITLQAPGVVRRSRTSCDDFGFSQCWGNWSQVDAHAEVIVSSDGQVRRGGFHTS